MLFRFAAGATRRTLLPAKTAVSRNAVRCFSSQLAFTDHESESFLTGTSSLYAEQMYEQYLADPASVHGSWKRYFDNLQEGVPYDENEFNKPTAAASSVKRFVQGVRRSLPSVCLLVFNANVVHTFSLPNALLVQPSSHYFTLMLT